MTMICSDDVKDDLVISPLRTAHCDFPGHNLVIFGSLVGYVDAREKVKGTNRTAEVRSTIWASSYTKINFLCKQEQVLVFVCISGELKCRKYCYCKSQIEMFVIGNLFSFMTELDIMKRA